MFAKTGHDTANMIRQTLLFAFVGGISFWLPDILLNWKLVESFALHTILPVSGLGACYLIVRLTWRTRSGPSRAMFMLIGIWALGSTAMMAGETFGNGGFKTGISNSLTAMAVGLLPPYTLIMATYDGSVLALAIGATLLVCAHVFLEKDRWVLPPPVRAWLKRYEYKTSASPDKT